MAKPASTTTTEGTKPKAKRNNLSAADRISKMLADVEALKVKEAGKAKAKLVTSDKLIASLEAKREKLNERIAAAKAEREELQSLAGVTVGEAPDTTSA